MSVVSRKTQWFDQGAAALNRILTPRIGDYYVCPICRDKFPRSQINTDLSFEHAPPESAGGKAVCLTCRSCNSSAGYLFDAPLKSDEDTKAFLVGASTAPLRAEVMKEGVSVRGLVRLDAQGFSFDPIAKQNHPIMLNEFQNISTRWSDEPQPGRTIDIRVPIKLSVRRSKLGWLRAAYLVAFASFGYAYTFQPSFQLLLDQLQNPDESLIDPLPVVYDDEADAGTRQIALVTNPHVMRSVVVTMGKYSVYLPSEWDDNFFSKFPNMMAEGFRLAPEPGRSLRLRVTADMYEWPNQPLHLWDNAGSNHSEAIWQECIR